jgi:hypothetical protein
MTQKFLILLVGLCWIAAQARWVGDEPALAAPAPHPELALAPHPELATLACARCHEEIAAEWATTQHAHAWIDPTYQEALKDKRRPESCHGCHIPAPLLLEPADFGKKPLPRAPEEEALDLGVSCQTCHAGPGGAVHGPFGAPTEAHASVQDERFSTAGSNALCAACHRTTVGPVIGVAKDFELANLAERGQSCVGCHMAPLVRPIAAEQGAPAYPARAGRSHALQTPRDPAFLAQAFGLGVARVGGEVVLTVRNRAGHRVPGLVGRRLVFTAEALDASGAVLATLERTVDDVAFLPVDGTLELSLAAPATALRVRGTHRPPESDAGIPFLAETLAVP